MNYGKNKISRNYDSRSAEQEIQGEQRYRRGFDGNILSLASRGGSATFSQRIVNNTGDTQRVALFTADVFTSVDELNAVLGENITAMYSDSERTTPADLVVTNAIKTRVAERHFSKNPSRIARLEVTVDAEHQSQLNNPLTIRSYSPTRNAGSVDRNLQVEARPTNPQANKVVLNPDSQIDDQTVYIMDIIDGATVNLTYVLGTNLNLAAKLFKGTAGIDQEL